MFVEVKKDGIIALPFEIIDKEKIEEGDRLWVQSNDGVITLYLRNQLSEPTVHITCFGKMNIQFIKKTVYIKKKNYWS